jgi:hypothetical protein
MSGDGDLWACSPVESIVQVQGLIDDLAETRHGAPNSQPSTQFSPRCPRVAEHDTTGKVCVVISRYTDDMQQGLVVVPPVRV